MGNKKTNKKKLPFALKGQGFHILTLHLYAPKDDGFFDHLQAKIDQAPGFFKNMPVVLNFDDLKKSHQDIDLDEFIDQLRAHHILPVGIQGGEPEMVDAARKCYLPVLSNVSGDVFEALSVPEAEEEEETAPTKLHPLIINGPVRSGMKIQATDTDLIIIGSVNSGAQVHAGGNIHVYGTLNGKAYAGEDGDEMARIFCTHMQAELISIAGKVFIYEDLDAQAFGQGVQLYLDDGEIAYGALDKLSAKAA